MNNCFRQAGPETRHWYVLNSPAVAVGSVSVDAELYEEFDDFGVSGADGVVQSRDTFVVRQTGVLNLRHKTFKL